MPTYEYACGKCGEHLEVYQSFDEAPLKRHRGGCGGKLTKVLAPVGVVLKGSGFYKNDSTDSARSKSKARAKSTESTSKGSGSTSESSSGSSKEKSGTSKKSSKETSSGSSSKSSKSSSAA